MEHYYWPSNIDEKKLDELCTIQSFILNFTPWSKLKCTLLKICTFVYFRTISQLYSAKYFSIINPFSFSIFVGLWIYQLLANMKLGQYSSKRIKFRSIHEYWKMNICVRRRLNIFDICISVSLEKNMSIIKWLKEQTYICTLWF